MSFKDFSNAHKPKTADKPDVSAKDPQPATKPASASAGETQKASPMVKS